MEGGMGTTAVRRPHFVWCEDVCGLPLSVPGPTLVRGHKRSARSLELRPPPRPFLSVLLDCGGEWARGACGEYSADGVRRGAAGCGGAKRG